MSGKHKILDVRCSNTVDTKSGGSVRCSSFIASLHPTEMVTVCRKCGTRYHITRSVTGEWQIKGVKKSGSLIEKEQEKQCPTA